MGKVQVLFLVKVIFIVSSVLLTRCLSPGVAINRTKIERILNLSTHATQLPNSAKKTQVKVLPTDANVVYVTQIFSYPIQFINKTWNCSKINLQSQKLPRSNNSIYVNYSDYDPYVCHFNPLHCKRPKQAKPIKQVQADQNKKALTGLPKYGDYSYLPISQWIWLLQHGAVVFLYHPCTSKENIDRLRKVAKKCMWKHIITPYEHLNITQPIAMVAWASFYADWKVNETASETWIKNNAMKGPASHVILNGEYKINLLHPAKIVSDPLDSRLCPSPKEGPGKKTSEDDLELLNAHYKTLYNNGGSSKTMKKHLLEKIKHGLRPEKRTINTSNAAWAVASLFFLCLVLLLVMVYTKPWNNRDYYLREKIAAQNNNKGFRKLKHHFKKGGITWREVLENERNVAATRRLLRPIHEEEEDFMDL